MGYWVGDLYFLINLPMGILSLIICFKILDRGESKEIKWDIIGTISQFLALFSTCLFIKLYHFKSINIEALILSFFYYIYDNFIHMVGTPYRRSYFKSFTL